MTRPRQLSPGAALLIGLLLVAAGALPMLAAWDIGPLGRADIHGPPWLGVAAGGSFAAAGLALICGPQAPLANGLFGVLSVAGLAAIGNWIAFGLGARACSATLSMSWLWSGTDLAGAACRIPFGLGALITDALLGYMAVSLLQKALGGPPRLARLLKVAEWLILASLAPFLLLLLLLTLLAAATDAVKTRWTSGCWPRNEEFIARQKAKGLLGRWRRPPASGPDAR